MQLLEENPRHY